MGNIESNLAQVRANISDACARSGRADDAVTLIAVTKTVGIAEVAELARLGVRDFGENRVQPGLAKTEHFASENYNWHFIGHLQRNKAAKALEGFGTVHSVESLKLAQVISSEVDKGGLDPVRVYLEVNVSGEESKYGLSPDAAGEFLAQVMQMDGIEVCGLMTMAPYFADPEDTRAVFAGLRNLRDKLAGESGLPLANLSMGMSNDYQVAIEEGATHVRVGSALFA